MWGRKLFDCIHKPVVEAVGGILVAWNRNVVEVVDKKIGDFSISILCQNMNDDYRWAFSGVYGPSNLRDFTIVRGELCQKMLEWNVLWCFGGDFNAVRYPGERQGSSTFSLQMQSFDDFIEEVGLVDLPLQGGPYTWSNYRASSRLDRFLFSANWFEHISFPQEVITGTRSYHSPILLRPIDFLSGPCPFKFEAMWFEIPGFKDKIKS